MIAKWAHFVPLLTFLAAPLAAQSVTGRVVRPAGTDSVPVPGVRVVLHRVGQVEQGPVDSIPPGSAGSALGLSAATRGIAVKAIAQTATSREYKEVLNTQDLR